MDDQTTSVDSSKRSEGGVIHAVSSYTPRPWQEEFHSKMTRFNVLVAHRRAGKTVMVANECLRQVTLCKHKYPIIYYLCPQKDQAKSNVWEYMKRFYDGMGIIESINESELIIKLKGGAKICVGGCDDPDKLRGKYIDFVVLDEAATFTDDYVWSAVLRPMLSDRKGGAVITGTASGHTFLYKMYMKALQSKDREWSAWNYTPDITKAIDPDELAKIEAETEPHLFQQEYWNNFDAHIKGTYWGKEIAKARTEGRVKFLPHDSTRKVIAGWDLGLSDDTIIWYAQQDGETLDIIDCDILRNHDLAEACKVFSSKPYSYDYIILPHDARQRMKDNKNKTQKGIIEELTRTTAYIYDKPRDTQELNAHINSIKYTFERCRFDRDKCSAGLDGLSLYRPKQDITKGVENQTPFHSDIADGFRSLIMGLKANRSNSVYNSRWINKKAVSNYSEGYNPFNDL